MKLFLASLFVTRFFIYPLLLSVLLSSLLVLYRPFFSFPYFVYLEVPTGLSIEIIMSHVIPYLLVNSYRRFRGHLQGPSVQEELTL